MLMVLSRFFTHLISECSIFKPSHSFEPWSCCIFSTSAFCGRFVPGMMFWQLCSTFSWAILWCWGDPALLGGVTAFLRTQQCSRWSPSGPSLLKSVSGSCPPNWFWLQVFWEASHQHGVLSQKNAIHHVLGRISNYPLSIMPSISAYKQLVMQNSLHLKSGNLLGGLVHFHIFTKFSSYKNIRSLEGKKKWLNPLGLWGKWCIFRCD